MHVCYPFVGDSVGGAQLSTVALLKQLPRHVGAVVVVHQTGPLEQVLNDERVPFQRLPLPDLAGRHPTAARQLGALLGTTPRLIRFMRRNAINTVHTQDGRMHLTWGAAANLLGVPHVWHQRSLYSASRLQRFMIRRATQVIANSEATADSLPDGLRRSAEVVANPVAQPDRWRAAEEARAEILAAADGAGGDAPLVIASVGNLRGVKQPLLQAESAAEAARLTGRHVILALFGADQDGWLPKMQAHLGDRKASVSLVHLGFRHPITDWLSGCDVLLAASGGDAFGRSLVEAMGVGVPVVATAVGGHLEIVADGENGLLADRQDGTALAEAINRIMRDPGLRERLIDGGHTRAEAFRPERHVEKMLKVYGSLVE